MDFSTFFKSAADNAPWVLAVVMGLVTFYGKAGLSGKAQLYASLGTGLVIGSLFMCAALGFPTDFTGWFETIIYGLAMGLTASGVYEVGKTMLAKAAAKQTAAILGAEPCDDDAPVG